HGSRWRSWFGGYYDNDDVIEATHRNETMPAGWHTFTPVQLQATLDLAALLVARYQLRDVIGHDDIAPGRKADPGPAFPMDSFRSRIFGRRDDEVPVFLAMTALNIRTGPGTHHATHSVSPLPTGTRMQVIRAQDSWRLVDVLDVVGGVPDLQGWVHSRFLRAAPTTPAGGPVGQPIGTVIQ
ncbi:MAG TPA: N-acetylmuramoyl-L-alanine amidase, partial [Longimicrobiales bacterium]|nr:N-acetylmuramoyl-L-alanine amidase [Longimicrobiales bacterium]